MVHTVKRAVNRVWQVEAETIKQTKFNHYYLKEAKLFNKILAKSIETLKTHQLIIAKILIITDLPTVTTEVTIELSNKTCNKLQLKQWYEF